MFRVVVKSNLSMGLAMNLTKVMRDTLIVLDSLDDGYESMKARMLALNAKKQVLTELPKLQVKEGKRIKALAKHSYVQAAHGTQESTAFKPLWLYGVTTCMLKSSLVDMWRWKASKTDRCRTRK